MKMDMKPIAILNLAGELSPELADYFVQKQILIVDPSKDSTGYSWTHILIKNLDDFNPIREIYGTVENNIKILSLTSVADVQSFILANGKMIIDEIWLKNKFGSFILDKFFQEYGGIAIGDSFPSFKEKGSFNIANPFNTGEYLDRMVHSAFLEGMSGLSIKTFFDHLVMYLTGLKTKGKIGMPIEVTYGYFEDVFGVQLNFYTKDLILEDVTASLSQNISKRAEEYLLNVAIQSSDFFDFTSLNEVNKTVITGLWTKDERIKSENHGFLFNELSASAAITNYPTVGITSFQTASSDIGDYSDRIILPSSAPEIESIQKIGGGEQKISENTLVKGSKEEQDLTSQTIKGTEVEDELINLIKGQIEETKEQVFKVGSSGFDPDKFAFRVSSGLDEAAKDDKNLKVNSISNKLPEAIKTGLFDFASKLNKSVNDLDLTDIESFEAEALPEIMDEAIENENLPPASKRELFNVVKGEMEAEKNDVFKVTGSNEFDVDNFAFKVSAGLTEKAKDDKMMKVTSLGNQLPKAIKSGLFDFAKQLNKSVNEISASDLDDFELIELPKIFEQAVSEETDLSPMVKEHILNVVKGEMTAKKEEVFRIPSSQTNKFDVDTFAVKVAAGLSEKTKGDDVLKQTNLTNQLPEAIKAGFHDYAAKINKSSAALDAKDIEDFKNNEIPKIIKHATREPENWKIISGSDAASGTPEIDNKVSDLKLKTVLAENENLKSKMKTLMTEVKIMREAKAHMAEIQSRAVKVPEVVAVPAATSSSDEALRAQILKKMTDQKSLSEQDTAKLAALMEKESKYLEEAKMSEMKLKKLQIESVQKDSVFAQELEKLHRTVKSKELIMSKSKDTFTTMIEQKDEEIRNMNDKLAQVQKTMANSSSQSQVVEIRELKRQVMNSEKMIEIYKNKMAQKPVVKVEDEASKEENRKLQMINNQMKNQLELMKKEVTKLQDRTVNDVSIISTLKTEKTRLDQLLKKASLDAKKDQGIQANTQQYEVDLKRVQHQYSILEQQYKESQSRQKEMEAKLLEAQRNQKKDLASDDTASKGKVAQLETNMRKLTQDLVESRNQLAEMKKETNKLRQEKTAIQNQLDKIKKDSEKAKPAAVPKKPGTSGAGGKAA